MDGILAYILRTLTAAILVAAVGSVLYFIKLLRRHRGKMAELRKQGLVSSPSPLLLIMLHRVTRGYHEIHMRLTTKYSQSFPTASSSVISSRPRKHSTPSRRASMQTTSSPA